MLLFEETIRIKTIQKWKADFACLLSTSSVQDIKGSSKSFPKHDTRHLSEHKVIKDIIMFLLNTIRFCS